MTEPDALPPGVHPTVALLPWYVNGTLSPVERAEVSRHVEQCEPCRTELEELTRLRAVLTDIYAAQPGPSPETARSVMEQISRERAIFQHSTEATEAWTVRLDHWLRSLLMPRWVPTLATVVLVAQIGILLWVATSPTQPEPLSTRSISRHSIQFRVVFQEDASEYQIRSAILAIGGHVTDGPSSTGEYTIAVAVRNEAAAQEKLEALRAHVDTIRFADLLID